MHSDPRTVRFPSIASEIMEVLSSTWHKIQRQWLCDKKKLTKPRTESNGAEIIRTIVRFFGLTEEKSLDHRPDNSE